jgi:predicted nucleic acid-binding protein
MRRYLLDTGPFSALLLQRPQAVTLLTPWLTARELTTSILVYGETVEALHRFPDVARRQAELRVFLRAIPPARLTYAILDHYAALRRALRPPHGPGLIGDIDTLIAATALARELTLVTTDSDFARVPGLSLLLLNRQTLTPLPR